MAKIDKVRDFDYTNDRLIIADMDKRDRSYVIVLANKINELIDALNEEICIRKNMQKEFAKRVEAAEKKAAEIIVETNKK